MSELARILSAAAAEAEAVPAELQADKAERENEFALLKIMYTRPEAAWVMSVSERTITRYIRDGLLPVVRLGSVVRIRREDIDELLKTHLEVTQ